MVIFPGLPTSPPNSHHPSSRRARFDSFLCPEPSQSTQDPMSLPKYIQVPPAIPSCIAVAQATIPLRQLSCIFGCPSLLTCPPPIPGLNSVTCFPLPPPRSPPSAGLSSNCTRQGPPCAWLPAPCPALGLAAPPLWSSPQRPSSLGRLSLHGFLSPCPHASCGLSLPSDGILRAEPVVPSTKQPQLVSVRECACFSCVEE